VHTIVIVCFEVQKIKSKREFISRYNVYCTPAMLDECGIIMYDYCASGYKFTP